MPARKRDQNIDMKQLTKSELRLSAAFCYSVPLNKRTEIIKA